MRALPEICQRQPNCHVLIVGGDEICYGKKLDGNLSYREKLLQEADINQRRIDKIVCIFLANFRIKII